MKDLDDDTEEAYICGEVDDTDICQICQKAWLKRKDVIKLSEIYKTSAIISDESNGGPAALKKWRKLQETMIICEHCEGSFHILCVGLFAVPNDDWYCKMCSLISSQEALEK